MSIYAERARLIKDDTVASGRRPMDRANLVAIRSEIIGRLALQANDTLLDIGSGIGMLTVPLSYFVEGITAVDHPDVLARMPDMPNIEKVSGDFLDVDMGDRRYSKILAYSTIHYLASHDVVGKLIGKAMSLLEPDGLFLLGDVPNDSYRERTVSTVGGQQRALDIGVRMAATDEERLKIESVLTIGPDKDIPDFTDHDLLAIVAAIRKAGHHAWILRQPVSLPFHQAREDILIQKLLAAPKRDMFAIQHSDGRWVGLTMREVQPYDCDLLYVWSQDPAVRAQSIRTASFTIEQHREWFATKMEARIPADVRWYMLEEGARLPIGVVRYERVRAGRAMWSGGPVAEQDGGTEVSITLAPQARGHGLSIIALEKSELHAAKVMPRPFIALIRTDNIPSIKLFEKAGYRHIRSEDVVARTEERLGVSLARYEK